MSGFIVENGVQNFGGAPGILENTTVNRPSPAISGRLFVDTTLNSLERDTGSAWVTIGGTSGFVPTSRLINTTTPLTGGGSLAANLTLGLAGLSALGTANQMLGMNNAATGYEYKTLGVGTTGTTFNIVNTANAVTFNIPDASTIARGSVNTGTQSFGGVKTFVNQVLFSATGVNAPQFGAYAGGAFGADRIRVATGNFRMGNGTGDFVINTDGAGNVSFLNDSSGTQVMRFVSSTQINTGSGSGSNTTIALSGYAGSIFGADRINVPADKNIRYHTSGSNYFVLFGRAASDSFVIQNGSSADMLTISQAGNAVYGGSIKTVQPSVNGAGVWKLGKKITGAVTADTTRYIELDVDGTVYKVIIST